MRDLPVEVPIFSQSSSPLQDFDYYLWHGDIVDFMEEIPQSKRFDLIVTSPPYNLGKEYETRLALRDYVRWQGDIIEKLIPHLSETGSVCWQIGNFVDNGEIWPLDIEIAPIFRDLGLQLRNRIVWHYGHGLHAQKRFSGRYEVILWFTKGEDYTFNLDPVRVPSKYPGKKHHKGPKAGQYSGNPKGKNPEDVWSIPNVKSNHIEKTIHPCQFPVGLIERLVLSLTDEDDWVFDPFAGVASAGVAAALHRRKFGGCDISLEYLRLGQTRIEETLNGQARYRPHDKPIYDHRQSKLSERPSEFDVA